MAVDGPTDDGVAVVRLANEIDPHSALYPLLLPKFTNHALPDWSGTSWDAPHLGCVESVVACSWALCAATQAFIK